MSKWGERLAKRLPAGPVGRWVLAPLWNRRNAALNDVALERLAVQPNDTVLELGFGGGYLLERILERVPDGHVAGADASPAMAARLGERMRGAIAAGRADIRCAPAEELPFPSASFAKAVSVNSIFYWDRVDRGLAEVARVLKPGGLLVLVFTAKESLQASAVRQGVRALGAEEVDSAVTAAGFAGVTRTAHADRHRRFWCVTARLKPAAPQL